MGKNLWIILCPGSSCPMFFWWNLTTALPYLKLPQCLQGQHLQPLSCASRPVLLSNWKVKSSSQPSLKCNIFWLCPFLNCLVLPKCSVIDFWDFLRSFGPSTKEQKPLWIPDAHFYPLCCSQNTSVTPFSIGNNIIGHLISLDAYLHLLI